MGTPGTALAADWLGACRAVVADLRALLRTVPATRERAVETGGRGEGGDLTLVIDRVAEDAVFARLDELHAAGYRFTALSEERGEVDYGDDRVRVVIDPVDGSVNAKRLLPAWALSVAVADGPTVADVAFAYVYDFGTGEEWQATRGGGAWLDGRRLDPSLPERRGGSGRLELLGLEQVDPRDLLGVLEELGQQAERLRVVGAIALTICHVAAARLDAMASLRRCRAVDAAAAQLIAREAGASVAFPASGGEALTAPLDVAARSPVVCARSTATLRALTRLVG